MPGVAGMNEEAIIASCRQLMRAGDRDKAIHLSRALEGARPVSEQSWQALHGLFVDLAVPAWAEIMTTRFLEAEPQNVPALVVQVVGLSAMHDKQAETLQALDVLADLDPRRPDDLVQIARLYGTLRRFDRAEQHFQKALALAPNDYSVRISWIHYLINRNKNGAARSEILVLRSLAGNSMFAMTAAMALALRIDDPDLATEMLEVALVMDAPDRALSIGTLIGVAARLRHPSAVDLINPSNLSNIRTVPQIISIYKSIEGRGLLAQEQSLISRGLMIDPADVELLAASRRMQKPVNPLFLGGDSAIQGEPRHARQVTPTITDRIRGFMFRR